MNRPFALVAVLIVQGCSPAQTSRQVALMDEVEQRVQLPKGAYPLANYARYYATGRNGEVLGTYVLPFPDLPSAPDIGCAELTENVEMKDGPCPPMQMQPESIKSGQRRWMSNETSLPVIEDGGCSVINVIFDPRTRKVKWVACNGFA